MPAPELSGGVSRELAEWLAAVGLDDVPSEVITRAKHLLLDGIGCGLVGARLPWSDTATDALLALEGSGPAGLIGTGRRTTPLNAALLNSAYIQGFELDDYHPVAPVHGACLVLPAMLALLPSLGQVRGADLLLGAIRGLEVSPRVGLALHGAEMLTRGWHSGPVFGGPGAAAAAGTLYGLDAEHFEDALGLAATQAGGLMAAQFESMGKRMQHGFACRNGVLAATLAAGGYTGIKQVFERAYGGFLATFGEGHDPDPSQIVNGLGRDWHTSYIAVKPYAAMAGLHAAIDATRAMLAEAPVAVADITVVTISMSEPAFHHGGWPAARPLTVTGAQMNVSYAVAVTLLDGNALAPQFTAERICAEDVWDLLERTVARHEPDFDVRPEDGYNTRVEVLLADGTRREAFVDMPRGGLLRPLSNESIVDKYRDLVRPLIDAQRAAAIETAVLELDALEDVSGLADLLYAPVRPIFAADPATL